MKKVYVLTSRCGTELNDPKVFFEKGIAYRAMEKGYRESLDNYDRDDYDTAYIEENQASIQCHGEWEEWFIDECEVFEEVV